MKINTPKKGQKVFITFLTLVDMRSNTTGKEVPRAEVREMVFDHTCNPSWCDGEERWACGKKYLIAYKPQDIYFTRAYATQALQNKINAFAEKLTSVIICQSQISP